MKVPFSERYCEQSNVLLFFCCCLNHFFLKYTCPDKFETNTLAFIVSVCVCVCLCVRARVCVCVHVPATPSAKNDPLFCQPTGQMTYTFSIEQVICPIRVFLDLKPWLPLVQLTGLFF